MEAAGNQEESVRSRMESLRMNCDREISAHQQRVESLSSSLRESLESVQARVQLAVQDSERLPKLRDSLKEAEDELVTALSVKTRKETRRMKLEDTIATANSRLEELSRNVLEQTAARDRYAAIISKESSDLAQREEAIRQESKSKLEIHEAITWYNKVLGLRIQCGNGVKFLFNNINKKNPDEFFSFVICHKNDMYSLLKFDPPLDGANDMSDELIRRNDLYKFLRDMRRKFQEAEAERISSRIISLPQESAAITVSAPCSSVSTAKTGSPSRKKELDDVEDVYRNFKKVNYGKGGGIAFSPSSLGSSSSMPLSSRNMRSTILLQRGYLSDVTEAHQPFLTGSSVVVRPRTLRETKGDSLPHCVLFDQAWNDRELEYSLWSIYLIYHRLKELFPRSNNETS